MKLKIILLALCLCLVGCPDDWTIPIYEKGTDVIVHGKIGGTVIDHINKSGRQRLGNTSEYVVLLDVGEIYTFKETDLKLVK